MAHDPRERVTIDLRGLVAAVHLRAAAERTTVAAFARRAIAVMLDAPMPLTQLFSAVAAAVPRVPPDGLPVKVTVRMPATHAVILAQHPLSHPPSGTACRHLRNAEQGKLRSVGRPLSPAQGATNKQWSQGA